MQGQLWLHIKFEDSLGYTRPCFKKGWGEKNKTMKNYCKCRTGFREKKHSHTDKVRGR